MAFSFKFDEASIVLNRFFVKQLTDLDRTVHEYSCSFKQNPEPGEEQRAIASICYKLDVPAIRLGNKIITQELINAERLQNNDWELKLVSEKVLDCANTVERKGIEGLERKKLEQRLKRQWDKTAIEKASEGGLIWWITAKEGQEKCGTGWEIHRGRRIDIIVDSDGLLYLEIDLHHRFYTPWTLHQWQDEYPDIPINYVRNTYKDKNNNYISWQYEEVCEQTPELLLLEGLGITLADYHRNNGATEEEIQNSRVIYVKRSNNNRNSQLTPHLSQRLLPSLTMEMLSSVAEESKRMFEKSVGK